MVALVLLLSLTVPSVAHAEDGKRVNGKLGWAIALTAVGSYELWAVATKHETMTQSVQRSKGMRIGVAIGLGALSFHLFVK